LQDVEIEHGNLFTAWGSFFLQITILAVDQFLVAKLEASMKHVQMTCIHDGGGDKQVLEDST
jgi:hypothetical protein